MMPMSFLDSSFPMGSDLTKNTYIESTPKNTLSPIEGYWSMYCSQKPTLIYSFLYKRSSKRSELDKLG